MVQGGIGAEPDQGTAEKEKVGIAYEKTGANPA